MFATSGWVTNRDHSTLSEEPPWLGAGQPKAQSSGCAEFRCCCEGPSAHSPRRALSENGRACVRAACGAGSRTWRGGAGRWSWQGARRIEDPVLMRSDMRKRRSVTWSRAVAPTMPRASRDPRPREPLTSAEASAGVPPTTRMWLSSSAAAAASGRVAGRNATERCTHPLTAAATMSMAWPDLTWLGLAWPDMASPGLDGTGRVQARTRARECVVAVVGEEKKE